MRLKEMLARVTEPREIVFYGGGSVRHIRIRRWMQFPALVVFMALVGWLAHVNVVYFGFDRIIQSKNEEIASAIEQNTLLAGRVSNMRDDITDVSGTLKQSHHNMVGLISQNDGYRAEVDKLKLAVRNSEGKRGEQLRRQAALTANLEGLERQIEKTEKAGVHVSQKLEETKSQLTTALVDRGAFASARDWLEKRVEKLEQRIVFLRQTQKVALARVNARTLKDISKIEGIIKIVGLDPTKLLRAFNPEFYETGGPFVSEEGSSASIRDEDALLERHLIHWQDLQKLLKSLPLIAPLDHYRLASGFGRRRDPVNRKWGRHKGIDMAANLRTTVMATAAGKVVFSGWKGRYGRMVEIDHGAGIKTRYGHLRRASVKRGQQVRLGDKIGQLGSSGRSTGPHVHYEIVIDGKQIDPNRFIKAGKDVFKG
jgi:murein DD-endopeptidase MepM/ murein hydrolase activator NlpD